MSRPLELPISRPAEVRRLLPRPPGVRVAVYLILVAGALVSVLPFAYMVTSSLKSYGSVITNNLWPCPGGPSEMSPSSGRTTSRPFSTPAGTGSGAPG